MLQVLRLVLSNQSALFESTLVMLPFNLFTTLAPGEGKRSDQGFEAAKSLH